VPFLDQAVDHQADAIIVHHGFFGKDFFRMTGTKKRRVKLLFEHDISVFGIHLPLDAHLDYGNNAQLFAYLDAKITEPYFEVETVFLEVENIV
jgi:putative NIF3 family GTP cyclohydrolase 1 type 2